MEHIPGTQVYFTETPQEEPQPKYNKFLHKWFPETMKIYYMWKYKNDILKVLNFIKVYQDTGITKREIIVIMSLDNDHWTLEKSATIFYICEFVGFIQMVR